MGLQFIIFKYNIDYMSTIYKYRIYCSNESSEKYVWAESAPTTCPFDCTHSIDLSKTRIIKTIKESLVKIDEGSEDVGDSYRSCSYFMEIPENKPVAGILEGSIITGDTIFNVDQDTINNVCLHQYISATNGTTSGLLGKIKIIDNTDNKLHVEGIGSPSDFSTSGTTIVLNTTYRDFSHPYNVGVLSYSFISDETHKIDAAEVHVYPEKIIGELTADVTIGDTILNVSSTVIENMKIGFMCILSDGNINECLGHVLNIDKVNSQITIQIAAVYGYSAISPTYVKLSVLMLKADRIGAAGPHKLGTDKLGSSLVRKNETVRVFYNNFSEPIANKELTFFVGHLY